MTNQTAKSPQAVKVSKVSDYKSTTDLDDRFPPVEYPRKLFFTQISPAHREQLTKRGYVVVFLSTLKRDTIEEERDYLLAKLQGMEEGTIELSMNQIKAMELALKASKLLDSKQDNPKPTKKRTVKSNNVMDILNWTKSRHTLQDNSTVQNMKSKKKVR